MSRLDARGLPRRTEAEQNGDDERRGRAKRQDVAVERELHSRGQEPRGDQRRRRREHDVADSRADEPAAGPQQEALRQHLPNYPRPRSA